METGHLLSDFNILMSSENLEIQVVTRLMKHLLILQRESLTTSAKRWSNASVASAEGAGTQVGTFRVCCVPGTVLGAHDNTKSLLLWIYILLFQLSSDFVIIQQICEHLCGRRCSRHQGNDGVMGDPWETPRRHVIILFLSFQNKEEITNSDH